MYNIIDYLEKSNKKYKDKIAIILEDKKISYEDLTNYSKRVGSYLGKIIFNEPIIVFMDKGIDALISFFGWGSINIISSIRRIITCIINIITIIHITLLILYIVSIYYFLKFYKFNF